MALLLTILQSLTLVILKQPMLPTEVTLAEAAVAYNALRRVLALLERAPYLLGRHAAAQGQRHVQRAVGRDGVRLERRCGGREVLAGVHEAESGWGGEVGAEREQGAEGGDGG